MLKLALGLRVGGGKAGEDLSYPLSVRPAP